MIRINPRATQNAATDTLRPAADQALQAAVQGIERSAQGALDGLAGGVKQMQDLATPAIHRVSDQAQALAQRGLDAVHDGSQQLRDKARQWSGSASGYVQQDPLKAVLIAAATGAALMALLSLMHRPGR